MKALKNMNEKEIIEHYLNWWFNNSLKDEIDFRNMMRKVITWSYYKSDKNLQLPAIRGKK